MWFGHLQGLSSYTHTNAGGPPPRVVPPLAVGVWPELLPAPSLPPPPSRPLLAGPRMIFVRSQGALCGDGACNAWEGLHGGGFGKGHG